LVYRPLDKSPSGSLGFSQEKKKKKGGEEKGRGRGEEEDRLCGKGPLYGLSGQTHYSEKKKKGGVRGGNREEG